MCIFTVIVQHSVTSRMSNLATGGYARTKTKLKKNTTLRGAKGLEECGIHVLGTREVFNIATALSLTRRFARG